MMFSFISYIGHKNDGDKRSGFGGVDLCIWCSPLILDFESPIMIKFLLFYKVILLCGT